jgi:hypothetical protein
MTGHAAMATESYFTNRLFRIVTMIEIIFYICYKQKVDFLCTIPNADRGLLIESASEAWFLRTRIKLWRDQDFCQHSAFDRALRASWNLASWARTIFTIHSSVITSTTTSTYKTLGIAPPPNST